MISISVPLGIKLMSVNVFFKLISYLLQTGIDGAVVGGVTIIVRSWLSLGLS